MEWIVAQQNPLDTNPVESSQAAGSIPELVIILIILLLIATVVALVTQRLRIPYVTGLVLAGLPITEVLSRRIGLDPSLVLNLFLPILIFEAAINTDISRLRSTFSGSRVNPLVSNHCNHYEIWFGSGLDSRFTNWRDSSKYRYCFNDCRF